MHDSEHCNRYSFQQTVKIRTEFDTFDVFYYDIKFHETLIEEKLMDYYIVRFYCHILPVKMIRISSNYHSHLKKSLREAQEAGLREHNRLKTYVQVL